MRLLSQRAILAAAVLLAAAVGAYWFFFINTVSVTVVSPKRGDAVEVVYATGIVEPVNWAKIASLQRKRIIVSA